MKYLNLGCGHHYVDSDPWTNLDFVSTGAGVIGHNLLEGIPFATNEFDVVYHSHVLEHFSKPDGKSLLVECLRVLKPGGIIRIAIPDLEGIVRSYIKTLDEVMKDPSNSQNQDNYNWSVVELFDQMVRNTSGGEMLDILSKKELSNEEFIYSRIGEEGRAIRENLLKNQNQKSENNKKPKSRSLLFKKKDSIEAQIGKFRLGGEIHQWMYDKYSLPTLLENTGYTNSKIIPPFDSDIPNWDKYELDWKANTIRKPDSLFVEARKPE